VNRKKYNLFNAVKNFRPNSVFGASASCSKILKDKESFNTVKNSGQTLFYRASAGSSKIPNVKSIFNTVRNFRANCFQDKRNLLKNPERQKVFQCREIFQGKCKLLKILNDKNYIFNTNSGPLCFSGQAQVAQKS